MTLWEALLSLAVAGVMIGWAAPAFEQVVLDSRRTADVNALVLAIQVARSEAVKRGRPTVLCKTADRLACAGDDVAFTSGWMVFVNDDDQRPPHRSPAETLIYAHQPQMEGRIVANRSLFEFRPFGWRSTNGTVSFCDARGAAHARAVIVSYTGRPRVSSTGPGGRALDCAEFP
jgi:type IV fimbrial biogenesis protein FimT